jgi:hypothetical protein
MEKPKNQDRFASKLDDLRLQLLGDVSADDLVKLQTHIDLLERAMGNDLDFHHHDTAEHHDHVTLMDRSALASLPAQGLRGSVLR